MVDGRPAPGGCCRRSDPLFPSPHAPPPSNGPAQSPAAGGAAGSVVVEPVAAIAARRIALQMLEERGRGAVLVGVARVDGALERLLQAVLLPAPGRSDLLFQADRPLGSFGARISLAYRLGLIESAVERALHTLRRLRNTFAHSSDSASLSDPAHAERLALAYREARANPLWTPLETVLSQAVAAASPLVDPELRDYILLITILVAFLEATAQRLAPQPPAVVMGFSGIYAPLRHADAQP